MALSTARISELRGFHCQRRPSSGLSLFRHRFNNLFFFTSNPNSNSTSNSNYVSVTAIASLRTTGDINSRRHGNTKSRRYPWDDEDENENDVSSNSSNTPHSSAPTPPWLQRWSSDPKNPVLDRTGVKEKEKVGVSQRPSGGKGSIERIVHRLRNLGLEKGEGEENVDSVGHRIEDDGEIRLGDLLERTWNRPHSYMEEDGGNVLPWERGNAGFVVEEKKSEDGNLRKKRVRAPTLAELTIEDSELRRLRTAGMALRERMTIPKAGVTRAIVEAIHDVWRKSELVRLKFHETLAHDMKTAHDIVERRTGGLVIWRAGSVMVVYRGSTYKQTPTSQSFDGKSSSTEVIKEGNVISVPDVSKVSMKTVGSGDNSSLSHEVNASSSLNAQSVEITEEEAEFNLLLDGVGPRFLDWWGTGFLPVDADLLPETIPGYKAPFRLLPTGMRSRLTNAELTNLRKLARKLPCHFALGRNRKHHGLAAAIVDLWEKSLVVKIAVKRGIQNTNNKLMADELKTLTGGILLQRNKYYIVIYRGKDFLPTSVATALAERQELTKDIQEVEERARGIVTDVYVSQSSDIKGHAPVGTLEEFQEAQARWGREISAEEREEMKKEASKSLVIKFVKKIEHKLSLAQSKKLRAETLLAKIESSMLPVGPSDDQETITEEERSVFRRIGLRMKAYLPIGIRGVFDGVIENMHLHWKHRELVKLISKQKTLSFVEDTARLLEYESGGILVAIERVPKGYCLIYYRGKNYRRPISIRPRNLLTKAKALKRSVGMQRHEALSQHISELERTVEQYKLQLDDSDDVKGVNKRNQLDKVAYGYDSQMSKMKSEEDSSFENDDKDSSFESEEEDDDDFDFKYEGNSDDEKNNF